MGSCFTDRISMLLVMLGVSQNQDCSFGRTYQFSKFDVKFKIKLKSWETDGLYTKPSYKMFIPIKNIH